MDNDGDLDMYQVNQPADKKLFLIHIKYQKKIILYLEIEFIEMKTESL